MNNTISENVGICNREDSCGAYPVEHEPGQKLSPGQEGEFIFLLTIIISCFRIEMGGLWTRCHLYLGNDK